MLNYRQKFQLFILISLIIITYVAPTQYAYFWSVIAVLSAIVLIIGIKNEFLKFNHSLKLS